KPCKRKDERSAPCGADQDAEIGRHTLAALEAEPDREGVAQEGAETSKKPQMRSETRRDEDGNCALQCIQQEGEGGELAVAGAQDVGSADITGADLAHVAQPRKACQNEPERYGTY